jgi:hypothetical protein
MWLEKPAESYLSRLRTGWRPSSLERATPQQRRNYVIAPDGEDVHWPDIDEDISERGMPNAREGHGYVKL